MNDGFRLADLLSGLSFVSDMGLGLPPEDAMRCCLVGTALARQFDLSETEVTDVFYTSLLLHIGCTGYAHESYRVWRDDIAANRAAQQTNFAHVTDIFTTYLFTLTRDMSATRRAHMVARLTTKGPGLLKRFTTATCEVAAQTERRLGFTEGIQRGPYEVFEWWDGKSALSCSSVMLPMATIAGMYHERMMVPATTAASPRYGGARLGADHQAPGSDLVPSRNLHRLEADLISVVSQSAKTFLTFPFPL